MKEVLRSLKWQYMDNYYDILTEWEKIRTTTISDKETHSISLLENYLDSKLNLCESEKTLIENFLNKTFITTREYKRKQQIESFDFNYFSYFNITEPIHSKLLSDLLRPTALHGQRETFLYLFLEILNIADYKKGKWYVATEESRVDIILKRREYYNVIIIENKSNNAEDRPNQLYRYWYYDIFMPYKNYFVQNGFPKDLPDNFKIIYLVSNKWKIPEDHSLTKPDDLPDDEAPKTIPRSWITLCYFNLEIKNFIEMSLQKIHQNNFRLREYLIQYKDLIMNLK